MATNTMVVRLPCPDHPTEVIATEVVRDEDIGGTATETVIEPCPSPDHRASKAGVSGRGETKTKK